MFICTQHNRWYIYSKRVTAYRFVRKQHSTKGLRWSWRRAQLSIEAGNTTCKRDTVWYVILDVMKGYSRHLHYLQNVGYDETLDMASSPQIQKRTHHNNHYKNKIIHTIIVIEMQTKYTLRPAIYEKTKSSCSGGVTIKNYWGQLLLWLHLTVPCRWQTIDIIHCQSQ